MGQTNVRNFFWERERDMKYRLAKYKNIWAVFSPCNLNHYDGIDALLLQLERVVEVDYEPESEKHTEHVTDLD